MPKQLPPIDDDIYEYIQAHAIPLEDDINSVLRRLLGLGEPAGKAESAPTPVRVKRAPKGRSKRPPSGRKRRGRAPKGSILPEDVYEIPILRALDEFGGRSPTSEVIDRVGDLLNGHLTAADLETLSGGDVRWRNRAQFVRLSLIKKGDMKAGSPRGVWELSEQGRERLKREAS